MTLRNLLLTLNHNKVIAVKLNNKLIEKTLVHDLNFDSTASHPIYLYLDNEVQNVFAKRYGEYFVTTINLRDNSICEMTTKHKQN